MDEFISYYFPNLKYLFYTSEFKTRKKQRWILTKEFLLSLETTEEDHSFIPTNHRYNELYEKLKYAYHSARIGLIDGILTGFFIGGVCGILKELNDFDFNFSKNIKDSNVKDEVEVKLTNESFTVIKNYEYANKYAATLEPISISKNTILTESIKKAPNNISPLDMIMRNSTETKFNGRDTEFVKHLFQQSEFYNKTNEILESLCPEVSNNYEQTPFACRKGREKVEIVGCTLIQAKAHEQEFRDSSSDSSENLSEIKIDEFQQFKTVKNESDDEKVFEDKTHFSENYRTFILNNLPDSFGIESFDDPSEKDIRFLEKKRKNKKKLISKRSIISIPDALEHDFLKHHSKRLKRSHSRIRKNSISFLVDVEDIENGYNSDEKHPEPIIHHDVEKVLQTSDPNIFLEEIKQLKENLLNEPQYQSSSEPSPESSFLEAAKSFIIITKENQTNITPNNSNTILPKVNSDHFPVENKKILDESPAEVTPAPKKRRFLNAFLSQDHKPEVVPTPRKIRFSDASHGSIASEVIPAPRKKKLSVAKVKDQETQAIPVSKETVHSTSPSVPTPVIILEDSSTYKEAIPSDTPSPRQKKSSISPANLILESTPTVVSEEAKSAIPSPRRKLTSAAPLTSVPSQEVVSEDSFIKSSASPTILTSAPTPAVDSEEFSAYTAAKSSAIPSPRRKLTSAAPLISAVEDSSTHKEKKLSSILSSRRKNLTSPAPLISTPAPEDSSTYKEVKSSAIPSPRRTKPSASPTTLISVPASEESLTLKGVKSSVIPSPRRTKFSASPATLISKPAPAVASEESSTHKEAKSFGILSSRRKNPTTPSPLISTPAPEDSSTHKEGKFSSILLSKRTKFVSAAPLTSISTQVVASEDFSTQSEVKSSATPSSKGTKLTSPAPLTSVTAPVVASEESSIHKETKSFSILPSKRTKPVPPAPLISTPAPVVASKVSSTQKEAKFSVKPSSKQTKSSKHPPPISQPISDSVAVSENSTKPPHIPTSMQQKPSSRDETHQLIASKPLGYSCEFYNSMNDNFIFINACKCAAAVGIICFGLSALKASIHILCT